MLNANGHSEVHLAAMAPCRGWVDLSIARPVERRGQTQWGVTDHIQQPRQDGAVLNTRLGNGPGPAQGDIGRWTLAMNLRAHVRVR